MADQPEGAALARRLTFLAVVTIGAMAAAVAVAFLLAGLLFDSADAPSASSATSSSTTSSTAASTTSTTASTTTTTTTTTIPVGERVLASLLGELSLRDKALQLLVSGAPGPGPGDAVSSALGSACVGGVFVSRSATNWSPADDPGAAAAAIAAIDAGAADCAIRPLVATDAEAGSRVLKVPVEPLIEPVAFAASHTWFPDETEAAMRTFGGRFAAALSAVGVHLNLGVVADVDVDAAHYMARQRRSFGDDPETVRALTVVMVDAHCEEGVAAALKHFPNQGATLEDPHLRDSVSSVGPAQWTTRGRVPYVDTAAPVVMTGHIRYPGVDGGRPASLSREITGGWLREDLGYDGVVITDDLAGMRGVTEEAGPAARAVAAIEAGADLVLFAQLGEIGADPASLVAALVDRATGDRAFSSRIDESVARVLRLKAAFGLVDGLDPTWFPLCG